MDKPISIFLKTTVIILLLGCSYLRHTYYINPLFAGEPFLISIHVGPDYLNNLNFYSMMAYFGIFALVNWAFGWFFLKAKKPLIVYLFVVLAAISAMLFGIYKLTAMEGLFNAGSVIKNMLLSPVYPLGMYIWINKIEKNTDHDR